METGKRKLKKSAKKDTLYNVEFLCMYILNTYECICLQYRNRKVFRGAIGAHQVNRLTGLTDKVINGGHFAAKDYS